MVTSVISPFGRNDKLSGNLIEFFFFQNNVLYILRRDDLLHFYLTLCEIGNIILFLLKIFFLISLHSLTHLKMISKKLLPVRYGDCIGNNCNALCGVGHLSCAGSFPKHIDYEYQHSFKRNRNPAKNFFQPHH